MKNRILILLALLAGVSLAARNRPERELMDITVKEKVSPEKFVYNWRDAVLLNALADTYRLDKNLRPEIVRYFKTTMARFTDKAYGKHPNAIASAVGFAFLKEIGESSQAFDSALERVLNQYYEIQRSSDGACSHRPGRVELWDDTVYMLDMALLGCYRATGDRSFLKRFTAEMTAHSNHLEDTETGMWYHGWAESYYPTDDDCSMYGWNTNPQHRNSEFWGRGNGWVAMAYADLLELLPTDDPSYEALLSGFRKMASTLVKYQDRKSGLWYQLPLHPGDKDNFLETSCSAMFAYALAKGVRTGVLPVKYLAAARKAYEGINQNCLKRSENSGMEMTGICAGTCIGDREYYYSRGKISDESYAIGAFILLGNELLRITNQ